MEKVILHIFGFCVLLNILSFSCVSAIHDQEVLSLYKQWFNGDGTYYGNVAGGSCSLHVPHLPPVASHVNKLVALNAPQMFGSSSCGICLRVNGSGQGLGHDPITGSFIVYVKDTCPECHPGDVDLAVDGDGRWKISIQAVQCPVVGNIEYKLEGSNDYFMKLQVRNDRIPTTTVEMYQPKHQVWVNLVRTRDGHWEFPADSRVDKPIQQPITLKLHAANGQVLQDTVHPPSMQFTGVFHGKGVQYPRDPSLPSA